MPFVKETFQIPTPQGVMAFLQQTLHLSQREAQKFVDKGRVAQNGEVVRDKKRILRGEVSVSYFRAVDLGIVPIFETPEFAVFDKPAGLLSHPKGRFWHFSLLDAVRFHFGGEANLINRLDCETSGVILASKNKKSEAELKGLFERRAVEKSYMAVVQGNLSFDLLNLSWGMQFRTCENFGESTDSSLVLSPKFSQIQKPHRHYFDGCFTSFANSANCDSQSESATNQTQIANSTLDSTIPQNLVRKCRISHEVRKSFCYFLLIQKVESSSP